MSQMFPARDGLIRIFSRRTEPLPAVPFYVVSLLYCLPHSLWTSQPSLLIFLDCMRLPTERAGCALQVTYGIALAVYLVSVITPSIWGPIQIIGATAGAVIGFIIPGDTIAFKSSYAPCTYTPCTQ